MRKPGRPKSRKHTLRGPKLSIRLTKQEKKILNDFVNDLKKRRPYVNQSIVYRELLGLTYTDLITDEDRRTLRKRIEKDYIEPTWNPDETPYQHRPAAPVDRAKASLARSKAVLKEASLDKENILSLFRKHEHDHETLEEEGRAAVAKERS